MYKKENDRPYAVLHGVVNLMAASSIFTTAYHKNIPLLVVMGTLFLLIGIVSLARK